MGLGSWFAGLWPFSRLGATFRRFRLLIVVVLVVLLVAFLNPVLDLLIKLLELGMKAIQPLLDTTVGRIFLMLVMFALTAAMLFLLLRNRVRELRAGIVLGRHLQAIAALIGDDPRAARESLRKVARYRGPMPTSYPALVQDANLKLARLALLENQPNQALLHLARVPERDLPRELERSLRQLRARALRLQGEVPPESLAAELEESVGRFKDDYTLVGELRTLRTERGQLAAAVTLQRRLVDLAPPAAAVEEQQRLRLGLEQLGTAALQKGDLDTARQAAKDLRKADREGAAWGLLQGAVVEAEGDLRAAVRAYGATRSPEGLDRIADLLRRHPGVMEPRELLECCPMQGTVLLVARELARQGEKDKAERAARLAAEVLGPTDSVVAALTEVLELLGRERQARLLCEQAVRRLVARDPPK